MLSITVEDSYLAKCFLDLYVMADNCYYDNLRRKDLEDGLLALIDLIKYIQSSKDIREVVKEGGLSNKCFEYIKRLEGSVVELQQYIN